MTNHVIVNQGKSFGKGLNLEDDDKGTVVLVIFATVSEKQKVKSKKPIYRRCKKSWGVEPGNKANVANNGWTVSSVSFPVTKVAVKMQS